MSFGIWCFEEPNGLITKSDRLLFNPQKMLQCVCSQNKNFNLLIILSSTECMHRFNNFCLNISVFIKNRLLLKALLLTFLSERPNRKLLYIRKMRLKGKSGINMKYHSHCIILLITSSVHSAITEDRQTDWTKKNNSLNSLLQFSCRATTEEEKSLENEKTPEIYSESLPDPMQLEWYKTYREHEATTLSAFKSLTFFVLFILVLGIVCYGNRDYHHFLMAQEVKAVFSGVEKASAIFTCILGFLFLKTGSHFLRKTVGFFL